jgi:hypothetical protein
METHQEGHALVLPLGVAQNIEELHLAVARWVPKNAKDQGRPITDMTYVEGQALNSKFSKEAADKKWGVVKHPTIFRVCNMINRTLEKLQEKNPLATFKQLRIWKKDLTKAYTLFSIRPDCVSKFAVELITALGVLLVLIFFCGVFGWDSTPACFQVATRAILYEARLVLDGECEMYVDDGIGCVETALVSSDMEKI